MRSPQLAFIACIIALFIYVTGARSSAHALEIGNFQLDISLGATTDYVWRGLTQTDEDLAASVGVELGFSYGLYVGAWASTVDFAGAGDYELDYYVGYRNKVGGFNYDVGLLRYNYPGGDDASNFDEIYASIGGGPFTFTWSTLYDSDDDTLDFGDENYYAIDLEFDLPLGFSIGGHIGHYDKVLGEYRNYNIWMSIIGITVAYSDVSDIKLASDDIKINDFVPAIDQGSRLVVSYAIAF